jgi:membrane glycosyltransferase
MKAADFKAGAPTDVSATVRMGAGSWAVLIVLLLMLAATFVIVYLGWTHAKDADVPISGYVAMAIGVIVSLAVGFGLMALIFYSSRKGYDEPPVLIIPAEIREMPKSSPEQSRR